VDKEKHCTESANPIRSIEVKTQRDEIVEICINEIEKNKFRISRRLMPMA